MSFKVRLFKDDRSCLRLVLPPALLLCILGLGHRDLWDPDEPRVGVLVRSILDSGSWAALSRAGVPYFDKPPLYHWLAAGASALFGGVSANALRVPSSLAAILCLLALFALGRSLFGRRVGALAAIVLMTSQDFFMEARTAHPDMLFTFLLALSALGFHQAYARGGTMGWLLVFYGAMGLATLTKGPPGLLLPLLAVAAFLAAVRDLAFLRRAGLGWGLPLALLPTLLWLAAFRASTGGAFPLGSVLSQFAQRVTVGLHHAHPPGHVIGALATEFLPWTLFLPGAIWLTFPRRAGRSDRENAYLYSWIFVLLTVFALSMEKRAVYLLPLLPFLALLVGRLWDTALFEWDPPPADRFIAGGLVFGVLLTGAAAAYVMPRLEQAMPVMRQPAGFLAGLLLLAGAAALVVHRRFGGGAALAALAAGLLPAYLCIATLILPTLDPFKSARPFSERIVAAVGRAPLGIYPAPHDGFVFYTGRPIEVLGDRDRLEAFLRSQDGAACLMEESLYEAVRSSGLSVVDRAEVGHRSMVLVRDRSAALSQPPPSEPPQSAAPR